VNAIAISPLLLMSFTISSCRSSQDDAALAASNAPLNTIQPERRRWVVELMRRAAANDKEQCKALEEAKKAPMNPPVYSPESFANEEIIRQTLDRLSSYVELDLEYFEKQNAARDDFRRKMAACDPAYLNSWDALSKTQVEDEQASRRSEQVWLSSVESLYDFAARNTKHIVVKDGQLSIDKDSVRETFDDELETSKALHEKLVAKR
jgi:hypothetical protein